MPIASAGAQQSGEPIRLQQKQTVTLKPQVGSPSEAGPVAGSPPQVTGSASVDTSNPKTTRALATVSAQGRAGSYRARYGAPFTTAAGANPEVVGHLQVTIKNLRWAGELRWDGKIVDFGTPGPRGIPDGCRGCLLGSARAEVVASVVNVDTGETLATQTVASPARRFAGPSPAAEAFVGEKTVKFPEFTVAPGARLVVEVSLTVSASSGLRPGATTGAATADFGTEGEATTGGKPTASTRPPKPGAGGTTGTKTKGVSYEQVTVQVTGTDATTTQSRCTATELTPSTPSETVLVQYFRAIDAKDYGKAFGLLDADLQSGWAAVGPSADGGANFASFMAQHVECVKVTGITGRAVSGEVGEEQVSASLGIQWYQVELDARYVAPFPAGSGEFQPFYKVRVDPHSGAGRPPDQILDIVTGLPTETTTSSTSPPSSTTSSSSTTTSSSSTTTSSTTTTTTRPLDGLPTAVVSMGDSFISGEAGRWEGNALNPLLSRAGTDRAFKWQNVPILEEVFTEVSGWGPLGFFTDWVQSFVTSVIQVPSYDPTLVYGDSQANKCHRSDVAEINAPIPGIEKHINLACSGAVAKNIWFRGEVPRDLVGPLPQSASGGGGEQQVTNEATQAERLVGKARENNVKLIVLSIGGNDLQFADIVEACVIAYATSSGDSPTHCAPSGATVTDDPATQVGERLDPSNTADDNVVHRVEKTIDQIRAAMETSIPNGGAGYAPSQYRIVLQSYPSPIPRGSGPDGSEFSYGEALPWEITAAATVALGPVGFAVSEAASNGRILLGCPFWNSDATWARDTLVPALSDALAGVATRKGVAFIDLQDFLQNREVCSKYAENEGFFGSPSGSSAEWARSIYASAGEGLLVGTEYDTYSYPSDLIQGDAKEPIHPNAYAQRGLQQCLLGAYAAVWNQNMPTAHLKCINNPGGPENVTTTVVSP